MAQPPTSDCHVNDLADSDLAEIFKRLPPYYRLLVSEVCKRWLSISRMAWIDVKYLDLSRVARANVAAVIKQCPNLHTIFCRRNVFELADLYKSLCQAKRLRLYDCAFTVRDDVAAVYNLPPVNAAWDELVLHDVGLADGRRNVHEAGGHFPRSLAVPLPLPPTNLRRLQLSAVKFVSFPQDLDSFVARFGDLQSLECLILQDVFYGPGNAGPYSLPISPALKNLRELYHDDYDFSLCEWLPLVELPKLEVLFLTNADVMKTPFVELVTRHPALRILVIAGNCDTQDDHCNPDPDYGEDDFAGASFVVPPRKAFPGCAAAAPLPLLHVFLGKSAASYLKFTASDAVEIHPISQPMPRFLEREDVAEIFDGVWVAEKIKEAAKYGIMFWRYEEDVIVSIQ